MYNISILILGIKNTKLETLKQLFMTYKQQIFIKIFVDY